MVREAVKEQQGTVSKDEEPRLDDRPLAPSFATGVARQIEVGERPVVPGAAIRQNDGGTPATSQDSLEEKERVEGEPAGRNLDVDDFERLDVDRGPHVELVVLDSDFCLVDCDNAVIVRFWIEQL